MIPEGSAYRPLILHACSSFALQKPGSSFVSSCSDAARVGIAIVEIMGNTKKKNRGGKGETRTAPGKKAILAE